MKKRHESLLRLQTTFECSETWEDMQGSASCRFCANCQREVIDLAQLTPRQVRARLEAARGKLCARLTRDGSRIRFAEPPAFLPARPRRAGKTSPFAAGLLSAFIGVSSLAAQPPSPAAPALTSAPEDEPKPAGRKKAERTPPESTASLGGQLKDFDGKPVVGATIIARQVPGGRQRYAASDQHGEFLFQSLPPGLYDLEGELEGFEIYPNSDLILEPGQVRKTDLEGYSTRTTVMTLGDVQIPYLPLRYLFGMSDLVVSAVVEGSEVLKVENHIALVQTRLRIGKIFKGALDRRSLVYRHSEYFDQEANTLATRSGEYREGEEILAFLAAAEAESGAFGDGEFESVSPRQGVRKLAGDQRAAYFARIEALAALETRSDGKGLTAADLMDWLVATAENPHTREEALREIQASLESLASMAELEDKVPAELAQLLFRILEEAEADPDPDGDNLRPLFLAAVFTEEHRERLQTALRTNPGPSADDDEDFLELLEEWNP